MAFCHNCGEKLNEKAAVCLKCGVAVVATQESMPNLILEDGQREWLPTLLICWFLGIFGVHRFYTGHTGIGVVQLLTLGGCGIWAFIDFILIIIGSFRDSHGRPLVKK